MKKLLLFLSLLSAVVSLAQQDTIIIVYPEEPVLLEPRSNDTLLIRSPMDGQILYGTMVIPTTSNQVRLYNAGLWLEELSGSECSGWDHDNFTEDRFSGISVNDSNWIISIQLTSNCCHKFLGDAALVEDSILNLIYIGYGGNCACFCCFGLTYSFRKENYEGITAPKYVMIGDDRKTLIRIPEDQK